LDITVQELREIDLYDR